MKRKHVVLSAAIGLLLVTVAVAFTVRPSGSGWKIWVETDEEYVDVLHRETSFETTVTLSLRPYMFAAGGGFSGPLPQSNFSLAMRGFSTMLAEITIHGSGPDEEVLEGVHHVCPDAPMDQRTVHDEAATVSAIRHGDACTFTVHPKQTIDNKGGYSLWWRVQAEEAALEDEKSLRFRVTVAEDGR